MAPGFLVKEYSLTTKVGFDFESSSYNQNMSPACPACGTEALCAPVYFLFSFILSLPAEITRLLRHSHIVLHGLRVYVTLAVFSRYAAQIGTKSCIKGFAMNFHCVLWGNEGCFLFAFPLSPCDSVRCVLDECRLKHSYFTCLPLR